MTAAARRRWRLRRRCAAIAASVPVPDPFDVWTLCASIGRQRGRAIHLVPAALCAGRLSGLWISTERADYVVFEETTSRVHQEHIILHELGHLLCRHEGISPSGTLRPHPAPTAGAVHELAVSCRYSPEEELEAELVASLLRSGAGRRPAGQSHRPGEPSPTGGRGPADETGGGVAGEPSAAVRRLENALVHGR